MFNFFRKETNGIDLLKKMNSIARKTNSYIQNTIQRGSSLIEIEILIFLYTITDYWFMMKKRNQQARVDLNNRVFNFIKTNSEWNILSKIEEIEFEKLFDNRIKNYFKILEKSQKRMDVEYFKACMEYQVQLIANILLKDTFSFYNPLPNNPQDYSPLIFDFMLISQVKESLMHNLDDILDYMKIVNKDLSESI